MKLIFSCRVQRGQRDVSCRTDPCVPEEITPIASLLADDGGIGTETFLEWIDEGISMVSSVVGGEQDRVEWDCEHWGTIIETNETRVYWLTDDSCCEVISTAAFQSIMNAWRDYVASSTTSDVVFEVE